MASRRGFFQQLLGATAAVALVKAEPEVLAVGGTTFGETLLVRSYSLNAEQAEGIHPHVPYLHSVSYSGYVSGLLPGEVRKLWPRAL
jgi:hypothetical protein